jgi:hypothetical protein
MTSLIVSAIVLACLCGGIVLGLVLRARLPEHHLSPDSKDIIKVAVGLIATMSALVLGLLVGSAKSSFDTQKTAFTQMSAKLIVLDRILAHYGSETKEVREILRSGSTMMLEKVWKESLGPTELAPIVGNEVLYDKLQQLLPKTDAQRSLQQTALSLALELGQSRWLLFQQSGTSISTPFLVVVVFWLTIIFASFGLFAPINATTVVTLVLCAASVAGAIFLILELDRPFDGMLRISPEPLRNALARMGL